MDFFKPIERIVQKGVIEVLPNFITNSKVKDLLVKGGKFYAIWDERVGMWSTSELVAQELIDIGLANYRESMTVPDGYKVVVKFAKGSVFSTWKSFKTYMSLLPDSKETLDNNLTFLNTEVTLKSYASKRLQYSLQEGDISAYDEIIGTLYSEEERTKIEWAIGSVISGDSKKIQKFLVLFGDAGTGKSTILNIIEQLFEDYTSTFDAKALTSASSTFSMESFKSNPLVCIQHDGDLSKIEDNTKMNSIVSHELMTINEKYKSSYSARINAMLFLATNRPVKITDAKSGIIRRLIDVHPSGRTLKPSRYFSLVDKVQFELGAIAHHCLQRYISLGKNYYANYKPLDMIGKTDVFYNFVEDSYSIFKAEDGTTLAQAYTMYKEYCERASLEYKMPMYKFREELKDYFNEFLEESRTDGKHLRKVYLGFRADRFSTSNLVEVKEAPPALTLTYTESILDKILEDCPAQYGNDSETPTYKWENVKSKLRDLDTSKLHYVQPPLNHIVIDFDLKDADGNKSSEQNLIAASKWPATYAEFSKGGNGIHLHYIYDGDATRLSSIFEPGIEVKVFNGNASLRRKLSKCNNVPIATINSGLNLKGEKVINFEAVRSENVLREMIKKNLRKEYHPATKPSIDFIYKILEDAYNSGLRYDVTDLRGKVLNFAMDSTNQAENCVSIVSKMKFISDHAEEETVVQTGNTIPSDEDPIVFFDVEVFPNLFLVSYKLKGAPGCSRLVNPGPKDIEQLLKYKLVGYNNRRYDNHILYAAYIGYSNAQLFNVSQGIINKDQGCMFREAYGLSYTDVFDFSSDKKSLKKWEVELGIHHQELGLPWDQPIPEDMWGLVGEYCDNDVVALEEVFNHLAGDWKARQILANLTGLTVNHTTQQLAAKFIFGDDKKPQDKFVYTDLSEMFPGYTYEGGKSSYLGEDPSEGGFVYTEPGLHVDVKLLDVESMHPSSAELLNIFGPYTPRFADLRKARLAIKHGRLDEAAKMFDGALAPYLSEDAAGDLSQALKIVINIVYGLTSAGFENKFRDPRNKDNIVAKRGALFMIDLKNAVQKAGYQVAHIKTDSIKIPTHDESVVKLVSDIGAKYGYTFEYEANYDRMLLINKAVYIAKYDDKGLRSKGGKKANTWTATGDQFAKPYVFKTLFSKEPIIFEDLCVFKSVTTALYLDLNAEYGGEPSLKFVGKTGLFCPVLRGSGGGALLREKEGKYHAANDSTGYFWQEAEVVKNLGLEHIIDRSYFDKQVDDARDEIGKYCDVERFLSDEPMITTTNTQIA